MHEVSITREAQVGEQLLGGTDLDAVKKGVSHVTKKRGRGPYRKYTDQDRAQIGRYCNIHGTTARVRESVSTLPYLNKRGLFSWGCCFKRGRISNCWNTNQAVLRIEAWSHWSAKSLLEPKLVPPNGFQKTCCYDGEIEVHDSVKGKQMGQMINPVLNKLKEHNILLTRVPGNMTHLFKPLDLTANGYFKQFMKQKFVE